MILPTNLSYPIVAVGDLHGQRHELERLVRRLEKLPEWPECSLVFLGDFVDRGPDVRGAIDKVLELLRRPAGGSAVSGNHDLGLVRAAGLGGLSRSSYWAERYRTHYDHDETFQSYLRRPATAWGNAWVKDLDALREAIPVDHQAFLASLPWLVQAPGHLFLHAGLSPELGASPEVQVEALAKKRWDRSLLRPVPGTRTDLLWQDDYPVWLGADKGLTKTPLPHPGKVQVSGHVVVETPSVNPVRIRIDTSGGRGTLTACLLRSADAGPEFFQGR